MLLQVQSDKHLSRNSSMDCSLKRLESVMTLDIRGSLKNTRMNANRYITYEELFSNAVDSYLIRKSEGNFSDSLQVQFITELFDDKLDGSQLTFRIRCTDNGAGLGEAQTKAFVTKDTSFKDDLLIEGIGVCKGSGRIQFSLFFEDCHRQRFQRGWRYIRRKRVGRMHQRNRRTFLRNAKHCKK